MRAANCSHAFEKVPLTCVAAMTSILLAGCSSAPPTAAISSGESQEWPCSSLVDVIPTPSFSVEPNTMYDCDQYASVSYTGLPTEELIAYVDELEGSSEFFVIYDVRDPFVSCSLTDDEGNSVIISQMDPPTDMNPAITSVTVVKVQLLSSNMSN